VVVLTIVLEVGRHLLLNPLLKLPLPINPHKSKLGTPLVLSGGRGFVNLHLPRRRRRVLSIGTGIMYKTGIKRRLQKTKEDKKERVKGKVEIGFRWP
jgi:hypothetical protein